eukprot:COSAG01_NODE_287_length_19408_cov_231.791703_26_plen_87_part_00
MTGPAKADAAPKSSFVTLPSPSRSKALKANDPTGVTSGTAALFWSLPLRPGEGKPSPVVQQTFPIGRDRLSHGLAVGWVYQCGYYL